MDVYLGLLRVDGNEPQATSGYKRVYIGEITRELLLELMNNHQTAFPVAIAEGYGVIQAIVAYAGSESKEMIEKWDLPEPVDVHKDVIPFIFRGTLYRGLEIQAEICLQSDDLCGFLR